MSGAVCAIVGATGAVGEEMLRCLEERALAVDELRLLASPRSVGRTMRCLGRTWTVEEATRDAFGGVDVALFSAGKATSLDLADAAVGAGATVVDNSSAFRLRDDVPLVVPEINADALEGHAGLIANPNCSTIVTLMAVGPLHRAFGVRRMIVSTYQAASGAGAAGLTELRENTRASLDDGTAVTDVFGADLAFNLIPWIGSADAEVAGATDEEMKMLREGRKILGHPGLEVACTCVRVPVERAHSVSVTVFLERDVTLDEARAVWDAASGVRVVGGEGPQAVPTPRDAAGRDDVLVGRLRTAFDDPRTLSFFAVGDQLRKGAALNAVQIAELLPAFAGRDA